MRFGAALAFLVAMTTSALADGGFEIVIPGRPGVPVIINGVDASYAVVEGDWGLARGTHVQPTVYGGRLVDPVPRVGRYYPSGGSLPGYGRLEIEPPANRPRPQPAESFHQSWSARSSPTPAQADIPAGPPIVIEAPPAGASDYPQDFPARRGLSYRN